MYFFSIDIYIGWPKTTRHLCSLKKPWSVELSLIVTVNELLVISVTIIFSMLFRHGVQDSSSSSPRFCGTEYIGAKRSMGRSSGWNKLFLERCLLLVCGTEGPLEKCLVPCPKISWAVFRRVPPRPTLLLDPQPSCFGGLPLSARNLWVNWMTLQLEVSPEWWAGLEILAGLKHKCSSALLLTGSMGEQLLLGALTGKRNFGFGPLFFGVLTESRRLCVGDTGSRDLLSGSGDRTRTLSPLLTVLGGKIVGTTVLNPSRARGVTIGSATGNETLISRDISLRNSSLLALALAFACNYIETGPAHISNS